MTTDIFIALIPVFSEAGTETQHYTHTHTHTHTHTSREAPSGESGVLNWGHSHTQLSVPAGS